MSGGELERALILITTYLNFLNELEIDLPAASSAIVKGIGTLYFFIKIKLALTSQTC